MRSLDVAATRTYHAAGLWTRHTWGERLQAWASRSPDRLAAADSSRRLTRREYAGEVAALADGLVSCETLPGQRVGLLSGNCIDYAVARLAISEIGAVTVPISVALGDADIRHLVDMAGVRVLIGPTRWGEREMLVPLITNPPGSVEVIVSFDDPAPPGLLSVADLIELGRKHPRSGAAVVDTRPDPDTLDILSATSGTTQGVTKLVARTQNQYYSLERQILSRHGITEHDRLLGMAPITQAIGSNPIYANLLYGSSYVEMQRFSAAEALTRIESEGITYLVSVPTHLVDLLDAIEEGSYDLSGLRVVYSAGAAISPDVARDIERLTGATFLSAYGAVDAGVGSGSGLDDPAEERFTTAGRTFVGDEVLVTDPDGHPVGVGEIGEFRLRGASGSLGYWADEEADKAVFDEAGYARTGDLGTIGPDGLLRIIDRSKDIIIRGGQNIVPAEIERLLIAHPAVHHASIVAVPDRRLGERCCAFIVPKGSAPSLDELRTYLRAEGLATYKLPEHVEIVRELPMSPGGKVSKATLRATLRDRLQR